MKNLQSINEFTEELTDVEILTLQGGFGTSQNEQFATDWEGGSGDTENWVYSDDGKPLSGTVTGDGGTREIWP